MKTSRGPGGMPAPEQVTKASLLTQRSKPKTRNQLPIYEPIPIGVVQSSADGRYINVNEAFCQLLGYPRDVLLQHSIQDVTLEEDHRSEAVLYEQLIAGRISTYKMEKRMLRQDGSIIWVELTRSSMRNSRGRFLYAVGALIDITERRQAAEELIRSHQKAERTAERIRKLQQMTAALTEVTTPLEVAQMILDYGSQAAGANAGILVEVLDGGHEIKTLAAVGYPAAAVRRERIPLSESTPLSDCMVHKMPIWLVSQDAFAVQYPHIASRRAGWGNQATVALPLIVEQRVIGALAFSFVDAREFDDEEKDFLQAIARQCAQRLQRARSDDRLRARDADLEAIINQTPFMFTRCSRDMRFLFVSRAYAAMIGRTPEEMAGRPVKDFADESALQEIAPYIEKVLDGEKVEFERPVTLSSGKTYVLHTVYTPDLDAQGNVIGWVASIMDTTERKHAEEALRTSEMLYRTIARSIPNGGVYIVDRQFRYIVAEGPVTEWFGYSREMLEGRTIHEALSADQSARMEQRLLRNYNGESISYETRHKDRVYWTQQAPLPDTRGHVIIVTVDITERKQVEEALRESEARYRALLNQAAAGIVRKKLDGTLLYVNQAFCEMLGYVPDALVGRSIWELTHKDDLEKNRQLYDRLMSDGQPFQLEKRLIRRDGSIVWITASVSPILNADGIAQSAVAVEVDITARKQAEQELQELNLQLESKVERRTAQLQRVVQALQQNRRRLVDVQEEERRAIAAELHDRIGQSLTALSLNLSIIRESLLPDSERQIGQRVEDSITLLEETIPAVRDLMSNLRPPLLDEYGLEVALKAHLKGYTARYGIPAEFQTPATHIHRVGTSLEMTLFRIAQEALFNTAKHAHAHAASVSLSMHDTSLCLTVEDDGVGIPTDQVESEGQGHGLKIMQERAESFGGSLEIVPRPGGGTRIVATVPIPGSQETG